MTIGSTPLGGEFLVNAHITDHQNSPAIAALTGGGYVITWESEGQDGGTSEFGVYAQSYDANGATVGSEFLVNTTTVGWQYQSATTGLADGGYVVTWTTFPGASVNESEIIGQRFDANGVRVGAEFQINTYTTHYQVDSEITAMEDGGFVVVWQSFEQDGSHYGSFGQRYNANGTTNGSEFQINTTTDSQQGAPTVTGLADGGFVVTWSAHLQAGDGDFNAIVGQRYNADGTAQGGEFMVNTYTISDQYGSSVTALGDGGFVVVWQSFEQDGSFHGIYGQKFGADGNALGAEFQVNTHTDKRQKEAEVSALEDGGFVVVWKSNEQDGEAYGIYGQRYDANGDTVGEEFLVNTTTAANQDLATVAGLADGGFVISWTSTQQEGGAANGFNVYAQQYDAQLFGTSGDDVMTDTVGADWMHGQAGNDRLQGGTGDDFVGGGAGDDVVRGATGNDVVRGGGGSDRIFGNTGLDTLKGGNGSDILNGGGMRDVLDGGRGVDVLTGGAGLDLFVFGDDSGRDTITDFNANKNLEDIDLKAVTAITDFADLKANHMSQFGLDVVIDDGAGTLITLVGVNLADLGKGDFLF